MNYHSVTGYCRENRYLREKAVKYAIQYAENPNPDYIYFRVHGDGGGDCSNFISQCLRAGGAPMAYDTIRPWWYNNRGTLDIRRHSWSMSWAVAHSLYWCLKVRNEMNLPGLKALEVEDIDMLELGDVIQYENSMGKIYHSAIVTAFTVERGAMIPLTSQHSYDRLNIPYIKPAAKKMHFMKIIL